MKMDLTYKSFCWSFGTTSFRTKQLNFSIEKQLQFLDEFWSDARFANQPWSDNNALHAEYYKFLKKKGFVTGDADRPAKDAREKGSGLVELGLIDKERRLTGAGRKILNASNDGDYSIDTSNILDIPKDSYQYFLQLLKASKRFGSGYVRPFVILLHVLNNVRPDKDNRVYLSLREFSYLLPMCIDIPTTKGVIEVINDARKTGKLKDADSMLISVLMQKQNYKDALSFFLSAKTVDKNLMCKIGINRKSGEDGDKRYDEAYFGVFSALHSLVFNGITSGRLEKFVQSLDECKLKASWLGSFFKKGSGRRLPKDLKSVLRSDNIVLRAKDENQFRRAFFKLMHLYKAKATLKDYGDLNRRYFRLSDVVVFKEDVVELDVLPRAFVKSIGSWLEAEAFHKCDALGQDIPLEDLVLVPIPKKEDLVVAATGQSLAAVTAAGGARAVLNSERYARFKTMLHEKFPIEKIRELLTMVEDRKKDAEVQKLVTDNADVPTIFEYVVGLAWYYVSGETGDVLEYMNLSLGSDFLPKTHAGGGKADIVWQYAANLPHYGKHALILEVTLSKGDEQRKMEFEPVTRHLGKHLLDHPADLGSYCTFVATELDLNLISDFRGLKGRTFFINNKRNQCVDGLKIMPIDTKILRRMLERKMQYPEVYKVFEDYQNRDGDPISWHDDMRATIENP